MPGGIRLTRSAREANRGTLQSMPMNSSSDANTGAAFVSFPLGLTPARALTPSLSLNYHANQGNGLFGMGVDLSGVLTITRSASRGGVPRYDGSDIFQLSSAGELVNVFEDGTTIQYRPRLDNQFAEIIYNKTEQSWLVREGSGINHTLGSKPSSQVASEGKIYQWWISSSRDARGNQIAYHYNTIGNNCVLDRIEYGNYPQNDGTEAFLFRCQFDYGDRDATQKRVSGEALWLKNTTARADQFTHYRAGFPITVNRLCQRVLLFHCVNGADLLVKYWQFSYRPNTERSAVSVLQQLQEMGCRSNSQGQYLTQALPAVSLDFSTIDSTFQAMQTLPLGDIKLPGTPGHYQWVDLYRDGLPGMLYYDGATAWYWRSEGQGVFSAPKKLELFPSDIDFSSPHHCRMLHLGKDKQAAFVIIHDDQVGYYTLSEGAVFGRYQTLHRYPLELIDPAHEIIDLNGAGGNDLVVLDDRHPHYYPELELIGQGYGSSRPLTLPSDFPRHSMDPNALVTFADLFGDGLLHRVSITHSGIQIWPNLGHGRFGDNISWSLPAIEGRFDPRRVFLVDVDGTGASDFVYACSTELKIFPNLGTGFHSQSYTYSLPEKYTHHDQLIFSDILGTGVPSIIFIKKDINNNRYYTGTFASQKPYLLKSVNQSSGVKQTFTYESSINAYLEDRKRSHMTPIRLPFVMPVLRQTTTLDPLTKASLTKTYTYHYGEYNFRERRFCGFAYVTETHHEELTNGSTVIQPIQDKQIKTWFYNRALKDAETNFPSVQLGAGILPSDIDQHYYKADETTDGVMLSSITDNTLRQELQFALRGSVIRQEMWAGQSDFFQGPASLMLMTCKHYNLRCDQSPSTTQYGIIVLQERESIHLEIDANDEPKIVRDLHLSFDQYNHVLNSVTIHYGRNSALPLLLKDGVIIDKSSVDRLKPLQAAMSAVYHVQQFIPVNTHGDYRYLHLPSEQKVFDASSMIQGRSSTVLFTDLHSRLNTPTVLIQHQRSYYWNDGQTGMAPFGSAGPLGLLHHQRRLLGQDTQAQAWYAPLLQTNEALDSLLNQNGYLKDDITRDWWQPEAVKYYSHAQGYYQITQLKHIDVYGENPEESLFTRTELSYDVYQHNVLEMKRYINKDRYFSTCFLIDLQSMKPCQVIDENQNTHVNLSDALNRPLATTHYGQLNGKSIGNPITNIAPLSDTTFNLMQQLSAMTLDDLRVSNISLDSWLELYVHVLDQQPRYTIARLQSAYQIPAIAIAPTVAKPIHLEINYVDGLGRSLQTKKRTDKSDTNQDWLRSTTNLYSISGQLLHQFLPSYCAGLGYEAPVSSRTNKPLWHEYDALLRLVQQTLPSGDRRQRIYSPWYHIDYDQNVMANKADTRKSLPRCTVVHFQDSADHPVGQLKIGASNRYQLSSSSYDALGRPIHHQDARLKNPNLTLTYNVLGQVIARHSVDRGDEHCLHHARGMLSRRRLGDWTYDYRHDSAQRTLLTQVSSSTQARITIEERVYGDTQVSPQRTNACGQLVLLSNEKGMFKPQAFDLKGECIQYDRTIFLPSLLQSLDQTFGGSQVPHSYQTIPSGWVGETFSFSLEYNPLGQLVGQSFPNGQRCVREYNALAQLKNLTAGTVHSLSPVVSNMSYQEAGLRVICQWGTQLNKGITTNYDYDSETQRLTGIQSFDPRNRLLQDQTYTFDPVGNITCLQSKARQLQTSSTVLEATAATTQSYTYDDFYRLASAQGLEMAVKPIVSDATVIPQHYFSDGVSFSHQLYTQFFTYDLSDNLTGIQHQHPDNTKWSLDFSVQEDSNQLARLTSTKDNTQVDLKGKALYDSAGNMKKLDATTDLTWDHTNQLSQASVDRSATSEGKVTEYYGYRGTAFQEVAAADVPGDRVAYTPGFFGSRRVSHPPAIDPKPFAEYGNRLYKITCFEKPDNTVDIIEQIFLGSYERKRIFTIADKTQMTPVNTLIRHTLHIEDEALMATHHVFTLDTHAREASRVVTADGAPLDQWQYHLTDHLHSSVLTLDDQGNVLSFEAYQPYGQIGFIMTRDAKQLSLQDYHYSSEMRDQVTGLYYYGARYYAPPFGRWLSPDPAGLVDGLNLYGFVRNNPMSFWDWWGFIGAEEAKKLAESSYGKIIKMNLTKEFAQKILGKDEADKHIKFVQDIQLNDFTTDDNFRTKWTSRTMVKGLDESFGVAAVREICKDIREQAQKTGKNGFEEPAVINFLALVSGFRLPTGMVGFKLENDFQHPDFKGSKNVEENNAFQHPTSSKEALYYNQGRNPQFNHDPLDKARGKYACDHWEGDLLRALYLVANYTVNYMVAPPMAANNQVILTENNEQYNQFREKFKQMTDRLYSHIFNQSFSSNPSQLNTESWKPVGPFQPSRRCSAPRVDPPANASQNSGNTLPSSHLLTKRRASLSTAPQAKIPKGISGQVFI